MRFTRITIIKTQEEPDQTNINELLQWFGGTLGLFNIRDKDKSCYRVFLTLIQDLKNPQRGLTSDEIAIRTRLTRGTVIHHLNKIMETGILISQRGKYTLSVDSTEELVEELRGNINKTIDGLTDIAQSIDKQLGL